MRKYSVHIKYLSTVLLIVTGIVHALSQVSVQADTTRIRIGEQITLKLTSDSLSHTAFPEKPALDSLHKLEWVQSLPIDTVQNRLIKGYLITGFDTGHYRIPPQHIHIHGHPYTTSPVDIDVLGVAVDTTKQKMYPERHILSAPGRSAKEILYALWKWAIAFAVLAALLVYWFYSRRKKEQMEPAAPLLPPYEEAVASLSKQEIQDHTRQEDAKIFYSELTDILRRYLERAVGLPALELPTDEWTSLLKQQNRKQHWGLDHEDFTRIIEVLQRADMVKFAKQQAPAGQMEADLSTTSDWIDRFHRLTYQPPDPDKPDDVTSLTKNRKNHLVLYIIPAVILLTLLAGYLFRRDIGAWLDKNGITYFAPEWYEGTYGYPPVSLHAPGILSPVSKEHVLFPGASAYRYEEPDSGFSFLVTTADISRHNGNASVVEEIISKISNRADIAQLHTDTEDTKIAGQTGRHLIATYDKKGTKTHADFYVIIQGKYAIILNFNYKENDKYAIDLREKILSEVQIKEVEP